LAADTVAQALSMQDNFMSGRSPDSATAIASADPTFGVYDLPANLAGTVFAFNAEITVDHLLSGSASLFSNTPNGPLMGAQVNNDADLADSISVDANTTLNLTSSNFATVGNVTLGANAQLVSLNGVALASAADELQTSPNANAAVQGDFDISGGAVYGPTTAGKSLAIEGVLRGGGTVHGNVVAAGQDPGDPAQQQYFPTNGTMNFANVTLDINGTVAAGTTESPTGYSSILVNGNITLDKNQMGTLTVLFDPGFVPAANESFALFVSTQSNITGDFATLDFPDLSGDGLAWNWAPSAGTLSLVAVPEPAAGALIFGAGALGLLALRRRRS
jgi:hypothetical protein